MHRRTDTVEMLSQRLTLCCVQWALLCIVVGAVIGLIVQLYVVGKNRFSKGGLKSTDIVQCDDKTVLLIEGGQVKALNL